MCRRLHSSPRAIDNRAAGGAALSGGGLFAEAGFIGAYEEDHVEALAHVHRRDGQAFFSPGALCSCSSLGTSPAVPLELAKLEGSTKSRFMASLRAQNISNPLHS